MPELLPKEKLQPSLLDRLTDDPHAKRGELIDEASRQFDLTPLEADFLYRQLSESLKQKPPTRPPA